MEKIHKSVSDEAAHLRARLEEIEGEPVRAVSEYCRAFRAWGEAIKQRVDREPEDPETDRWREYLSALETLNLPIVKSCLLARLIYGGEELRTEPCPEHKGHWSGCVWEDLPCGCVVGANLQALRSLRWNYKRRGALVWLKGRHRCWRCRGAGVVDSIAGAHTRLCPQCEAHPKRGYQRILSEPEQVLAEQERAAAGAAT